MKQLVVCTSDFHQHYAGTLQHGAIKIGDTEVAYALIERESPAFDPERYPQAVLIRKHAFSCNYRDLSIMRMACKKIAEISQTSGNTPCYAIGSEFVGTVVEVGNDVTTLKPGEQVIGNHAFPHSPVKEVMPGIVTNHASSELEIIHQHKLAKIPDNMDLSVAAAFSIAAQTAYSMLEKLDIQPKSSVLITGIRSNTSIFIRNVLKNRDVRLFGLSRKPVGEGSPAAEGFEKIFHVKPDEQISDHQQIRAHFLAHGKFDYVIDPFGDDHLFRLLDMIASEGKYITCGISNQSGIRRETIESNIVLSKIIMNNIQVIGNCLGSSKNLQDALKDYEQGLFEVTIDQVNNDDIVQFMERTFLSGSRFGKVIFQYDTPELQQNEKITTMAKQL